MPDERKRAILDFVEEMTSKPSELYLKIVNHVMENPRPSSLDDFLEEREIPEVRVHRSPEESTCTACEG